MKTFPLSVLTPYGEYLKGDVEYLEVRAEHSVLGILANHQPLVSTVMISKMKVRMNGQEFYYSIGGGILYVEKDKVTLVLNSIESPEEIDIERAKRAKDRAENLLKKPSHELIDVARAEASLKRALVRIDLFDTFK